MPVKLRSDPPVEGADIISRTMGQLATHPFQQERPGVRLDILPPIGSYELGLEAIGPAQDSGLESAWPVCTPDLNAARLAAWLYMLTPHDHGDTDQLEDVAGVVELMPPGVQLDATRRANGWTVGAMSVGPVYHQLGRVLHAALGARAFAHADYEPRLLSAPFGVRAVWMRHPTGTGDRFYRLTGQTGEVPDPVELPQFASDLSGRLAEWARVWSATL